MWLTDLFQVANRLAVSCRQICCNFSTDLLQVALSHLLNPCYHQACSKLFQQLAASLQISNYKGLIFTDAVMEHDKSTGLM